MKLIEQAFQVWRVKTAHLWHAVEARLDIQILGQREAFIAGWISAHANMVDHFTKAIDLAVEECCAPEE